MFEIYYYSGGSVGPFHTFGAAFEAAQKRLKGSNETYIEIRPYNSNYKGGFKGGNKGSTYLQKIDETQIYVKEVPLESAVAA